MRWRVAVGWTGDDAQAAALLDASLLPSRSHIRAGHSFVVFRRRQGASHSEADVEPRLARGLQLKLLRELVQLALVRDAAA